MTPVNEPVDAAEQRGRREDRGRLTDRGRRGPIADAAPRQQAARLRGAGLWVGLAAVVGAPQAVLAALGVMPRSTEFFLLVGSAFLACYAAATVATAPAMPPWTYRLWLTSKMTATTMVSFAILPILLAGAFGLPATLPILGVAGVSALGTVLIRHSLPGCAILPIAMCTLIGAECTRLAFETPGDSAAYSISAVAAFAVAAIMALLVLAAGPSGRVRR